jgi:hypothetical protein
MCPSALLLLQIKRTGRDILTILGTTHQRNRTSRFFSDFTCHKLSGQFRSNNELKSEQTSFKAPV